MKVKPLRWRTIRTGLCESDQVANTVHCVYAVSQIFDDEWMAGLCESVEGKFFKKGRRSFRDAEAAKAWCEKHHKREVSKWLA